MKEKSQLRVVIVNGRPGVGKTTFEDYCGEVLGYYFVKRRSTIDIIKWIASQYGWTGSKELKDRKFLSDLKDIFTNYNDLPHKDIKKFLVIGKSLKSVKEALERSISFASQEFKLFSW